MHYENSQIQWANTYFIGDGEIYDAAQAASAGHSTLEWVIMSVIASVCAGRLRS